MANKFLDKWNQYNNIILEQECRINNTTDINKDRAEQPQIQQNQVQDFLLYLRQNNIEFFKIRIPVYELIASQSSVDCDKVKSLAKQPNSFNKLSNGQPIFISKDNVIGDGHHRVYALKLIDKNADLSAWEVQTDIDSLLKMMKDFLNRY